MSSPPPEKPPIPVILSGLPGHMATLVGEALLADKRRFRVASRAFSGEAAAGGQASVGGRNFELLGPPTAEKLRELLAEEPEAILLDYSAPGAATANALAAAEAGCPFVTGTTGLDPERVRPAAMKAGVPAVAAPNMAAAIVILTEALHWASEHYAGALEGFSFRVVESHQAAKRDVSGTARRLLPDLARLAGAEPDEATQIESVRDPERQRALGIPEANLDGHAWHRYELTRDNPAAGSKVTVALEHLVLGRDAYVEGTLKALRFVAGQAATLRRAGLLGKPGLGALFTMREALASEDSRG